MNADILYALDYDRGPLCQHFEFGLLLPRPPSKHGWVVWWSSVACDRGLHHLNFLIVETSEDFGDQKFGPASEAPGRAICLLGFLVPEQLLIGHGLSA